MAKDFTPPDSSHKQHKEGKQNEQDTLPPPEALNGAPNLIPSHKPQHAGKKDDAQNKKSNECQEAFHNLVLYLPFLVFSIPKKEESRLLMEGGS